MPVALVTGSTGFVGSTLVRELLARGFRVRAFLRPAWRDRAARHPQSAAVLPPGIDTHYGDIRDADAIARAAEGCDTVFHTAAVVSFKRRSRAELHEVNAGGTRAVARACLAAGVGRLVHTSSVAAVGRRSDGGLADETTAFNWPETLAYRYSKHLAENEILEAVSRGLDAVIVNPSVIVGPGDRYVHGGQLVRDAARGKLFAWPPGGMNLVAVSDVAAGHIAAAERGRKGERYILGGANLTHREAFEWAAAMFGGRRPLFRLPAVAVKAVARAAEIASNLTGTEPLLTADMVAGVGRYQWFSILKARTELGYNPVSLEKSLRDAYIWYREHGML